MATRRDIIGRKAQLRRSLMKSCRDGSFGPGDMLPSLRLLAQEHGLSPPTASQVIRELVEEGVLYTRSTAGTFVGRPQEVEGSLYLMVMPAGSDSHAHVISLRNGFEERVAQLGGSSLCLDHVTAQRWRAEGRLPAYAGMFAFGLPTSELSAAEQESFRVEYGSISPDKPHTDMVFFADEDGGRQATSHLLRLGHSKIAFLGLHTASDESNVFIWSKEREKGWCQALEQAGNTFQSLAFHPRTPLSEIHDHDEQRQAGCEAARDLVRRLDITAVVCANAYTTDGLLEALRHAQVPKERWPAVVSFDEFPYHTFDQAPYNDRHVISALRLPWENLGRDAASLLWERSHGSITGPAQQRLVSMKIIPRLSCRREWPFAPVSPSLPQRALVPMV